MDGHGGYEAGESAFGIQPGYCFLFRPGEKVIGRSDDDRPFTIFAAHFEKVSAPEKAAHPLHCQIREISLMELLAEHTVIIGLANECARGQGCPAPH